ncbi:MAG: MmgE/PrpD family protein, partial [Elioraea tepidiphila]
MAAVTTELSAWCARITPASLPEQVLRRAAALTLDLVGNMVRARHDAESTPALIAAVRALGLCGGEATVFGDPTRYTPAGAALLGAGGVGWAAPFALLHGAGNGIMTIAKGTLPLVLFGPAGYGQRQGWLALPARLAQAAAPVAFALLLAGFGSGALW